MNTRARIFGPDTISDEDEEEDEEGEEEEQSDEAEEDTYGNDDQVDLELVHHLRS